MTDVGQMERAVLFAFKSSDDDDRDAAARQLVRRYARLIDESEASQSDLLVALARVAAAIDGDDLADDLARIGRQLRAVTGATVVNDLGPKLLAGLQQLGLTPLSRGATEVSKPNGNPVPNTLRAIRDDRAKQRPRAS